MSRAALRIDPKIQQRCSILAFVTREKREKKEPVEILEKHAPISDPNEYSDGCRKDGQKERKDEEIEPEEEEKDDVEEKGEERNIKKENISVCLYICESINQSFIQ